MAEEAGGGHLDEPEHGIGNQGGDDGRVRSRACGYGACGGGGEEEQRPGEEIRVVPGETAGGQAEDEKHGEFAKQGGRICGGRGDGRGPARA